jgi:oxygen-independent coproporphyrinogen III oxidase
MNLVDMRSEQIAAAVPAVPLLCRFDVAASRYACFPTADRFTDAFDADAAAAALRERGTGMLPGGPQPLSIDIRIPLGRSAYPRASSPKHWRALRHVAAIEEEARLVAAALTTRQAVSEVRFGGDGIAALGDAFVERLLEVLGDAFSLPDDVPLSVAVDPTKVTVHRLSRFRELGFRRLEFDLRRPCATHRFEAACGVMGAARELGFTTLVANVACTPATVGPADMAPCISAIAALGLNRIRLECAATPACTSSVAAGAVLPISIERARRAAARAAAIRTLLAAGYVHVGMDQFALPADRLAVARRQGRCHVDLDGVRERCEGDIVGLGIAATSRIGPCYYRNFASEAAYRDALDLQRLPVEAGIRLGRDDLVRRSLIHALIGNRRVDFESIELAHLVQVRQYFARELGRLPALVRAGLADMDAQGVELTAAGDYLACAVAMAFDRRRPRAGDAAANHTDRR